MSKKLIVRYEPDLIPWKTLEESFGKQQGPRQAEVMLTIHTVDDVTLEPVSGMVSSYNPGHLDDPNTLNFSTNSAHLLALSQIRSPQAGHPMGATFYCSPAVQVNAPGYEAVILYLN